MRSLFMAVGAMLFAATAQAATFAVEVNKEGQTYIQMTGQTVEHDSLRLEDAIEEAKGVTYLETADVVVDGEVVDTTEVERTREFSNELHLKGPGGNMFAGIRTAWIARAAGLDTVANGQCASACSLIFLAGTERKLGASGALGFHLPFVMETYPLDKLKDRWGWMGVQDNMNSTSALFMTYLLYFGVEHDYILMYELAQIEGTRELFWVSHHNFEIVGSKGRVH